MNKAQKIAALQKLHDYIPRSHPHERQFGLCSLSRIMCSRGIIDTDEFQFLDAETCAQAEAHGEFYGIGQHHYLIDPGTSWPLRQQFVADLIVAVEVGAL